MGGAVRNEDDLPGRECERALSIHFDQRGSAGDEIEERTLPEGDPHPPGRARFDPPAAEREKLSRFVAQDIFEAGFQSVRSLLRRINSSRAAPPELTMAS